jgi:D-alanyl-D-alanine carboxypeptidase
MKNLTGHVYAKTGSIGGVSALSGYVKGPDEQYYAFSVLCNDINKAKGGGGAAHQLQDEICRTLATWNGK